MKEENKIPFSQLKKSLQARMNYDNADLAFKTLLYGWRRHPQFDAPSKQTLREREKKDRHRWLRVDEVQDFEAYIGYTIL